MEQTDALTSPIRDSVDPAAESDAAGGYEALLAGLRRGEELRDEGEPWGGELVARWQAALEAFAARHRIGRA